MKKKKIVFFHLNIHNFFYFVILLFKNLTEYFCNYALHGKNKCDGEFEHSSIWILTYFLGK